MLLSNVCLTCDVCLSVAYIGSKSRTERPRKTKIDTEVVHVTRDSDSVGSHEQHPACDKSHTGNAQRVFFGRTIGRTRPDPKKSLENRPVKQKRKASKYEMAKDMLRHVLYCVQKKTPTLILDHNFGSADRFSKLFHLQTQQ